MRVDCVALAQTMLTLAGLASCASAPRHDTLYRLEHDSATHCPHRVDLLSLAQISAPSYAELARLSATCPQLSPETCERNLLAKGCELNADAIVITSATLIGKRGRPQLEDDAIALRFTPAQPAALPGALPDLAPALE